MNATAIAWDIVETLMEQGYLIPIDEQDRQEAVELILPLITQGGEGE